MTGGFYGATVKSSGTPVTIRVVGDRAQIVERQANGEWRYDPNWYPVRNFTLTTTGTEDCPK